jgi:small subunit ribosomal protein S9
MTPSKPGDPQKGKPAEAEQAELEATEAKQAAAVEAAQEKAAPDAPPADAAEADEQDKPKPRRRRSRKTAAEEPVAEAASDDSAAEQPAAEQPAADEPVAEETSAEEPAADAPAADEPAAAEPAAEDPAAEEPAAEEPAAEEPAAKDAAADAPAAEEKPKPKPKRERKQDAKDEPEVIPGAHLEPDLVLEDDARPAEGSEYADLEAGEEPSTDADATGGDADDEAPAPLSAVLDLAADARYRATGKRKSAVARVTLKPGSGQYTINGKTLEEYFPRPTLQTRARTPLETVAQQDRMDVVAKIHGGGVSAQAGALRHGITRALVEADPNLRGELKRRGFLTRDPRVKERKKAGLKKARKRPQFSKR